MDLIVYVNKHYEEERALVDLDKEAILLSGDYYHDKIDDQINGYVKALNDMGVYDKEEVPHKYIDRNHKWYGALDFYDDEYDEPDDDDDEEFEE